MINRQKIYVDLVQKYQTTPPVVYVKQNDSESRTVEAHIKSNGAVPTGINENKCNVYFDADSGPIFLEGLSISSAGVVTFIIPQNALSRPGKMKCEICITDSDNAKFALSTMDFYVDVSKSVADISAEIGQNQGDLITAVQKYNEQAQQAAEDAQAAAADAAKYLNPLEFAHTKDGNLYKLTYSSCVVIANGQIKDLEAGSVSSLSQQNYIYLKPDNTLFADPSGTLVEDGTFPDYILIGYDNGSTSTFWDGDVYKHNKDDESHPDLRNLSESNRFIHDVDIEFSGSTITSATYKYGAETVDITETLSTVPIATINAGVYYIRDSGAITTDCSDTQYTYIAKIDIGGSPQVIQSLEYLPIDQKTAVPAYEELRQNIASITQITDEITTTTRQIVNAAYFNDISSANPGMSISGLAENDTVYVYGRNLAPKIPTQEKNGLTLTQNADGSVTINGTATGDSSTTFSVSGNVTLPKGATFTFSGCTTGSNSTYRMYVYQPGWQQCFLVHGGMSKPITNFAVTTKPITVTMTQTLPVTITVLVPSGQTMDNVTLYPMCELGETTRGYVPYIEAESYTANSNGHVSCVPTQPEATVIAADKSCTVEYNQNTQIASKNAERRINQTATNALIGTKTGTVARTDDVSPLPHAPQVEITGATADGTSVVNPVVKAYGKNLLDLDTYQMETQTINGVTITNYGNGYFELTGTPTEAQTVQLNSSQFYASDGLNIYPPGTYTAPEGITVTLRKAADNSGIGNKSGTFTVDEAFYISQWYVFVTAAGVVGGTNGKTTPFGFRPQLEAGDTATDYEAYKEPQSYSYTGTLGTNNRFTLPDGTFNSVYPTMTMTVTNNNSGIAEGTLSVQYNRDINAAFAELMNAIAAQA